MKRDRKLISSEKHEIAYIRKIAREQLEEYEYISELVDDPNVFAKEIRLCKAVLKFAKYKAQKKDGKKKKK